MLATYYGYMGYYAHPLAAAAAAIGLLSVERTYSLWMARDHGEPNLRRRLGLLRYLAVAAALVGAVGCVAGLAEIFFAFSEASPPPDHVMWLGLGMAVLPLFFGLLLSFVAVSAHFVFSAKVDAIRRGGGGEPEPVPQLRAKQV